MLKYCWTYLINRPFQSHSYFMLKGVLRRRDIRCSGKWDQPRASPPENARCRMRDARCRRGQTPASSVSETWPGALAGGYGLLGPHMSARLTAVSRLWSSIGREDKVTRRIAIFDLFDAMHIAVRYFCGIRPFGRGDSWLGHPAVIKH